MPEKREGCLHTPTPLPPGGWNGPVGTCRCCGLVFGYIDGGSWTQRRQEVTENDPTLCRGCGGSPARTVRENGVIIEHERGSADREPLL